MTWGGCGQEAIRLALAIALVAANGCLIINVERANDHVKPKSIEVETATPRVEAEVVVPQLAPPVHHKP